MIMTALISKFRLFCLNVGLYVTYGKDKDNFSRIGCGHMSVNLNITEIAQWRIRPTSNILRHIFHCDSLTYDPIWVNPTKPSLAVQ